jgi:hypothetical protein
MKVLIDEDLPVDLRLHISGHEVFTVRYQRWNGLKNGKLLKVAEESAFDVLLTGDQGLNHQQNPKIRQIAIVALSLQELPDLLANLDAIHAAIARASTGSFERVSCRRISRAG